MLTSERGKQKGITLMELMIVLAILGILAAYAAPSFQTQMSSRRIQGAAEALAASMQNARAEAIKRNQDVWIVFTPTNTNTTHGTWCFGMTRKDDADDTCDCSVADECDPGSVVSSADYTGVSVSFNQSNNRNFDPLRGTATSGTVTFIGEEDLSLGVTSSGLGRVRLCLPDGSHFITNSADCP